MYFKTKVKLPMQNEEGEIKITVKDLLVQCESWTEAEAVTYAWAEQNKFGEGDISVENVGKTPINSFAAYETDSEYWIVTIQYTTDNDYGTETKVTVRMALVADGIDDVIELMKECAKETLIHYKVKSITSTSISEYVEYSMFFDRKSSSSAEVVEETDLELDTYFEEDYGGEDQE
jgi:hypothetical protein